MNLFRRLFIWRRQSVVQWYKAPPVGPPFIYAIQGKEGNVIFNDALSTCLQIYGVGHMVKDSEKGIPSAATTWATLSSNKWSFICTNPQTGQHIPQPLLCQSWSTGWNEK